VNIAVIGRTESLVNSPVHSATPAAPLTSQYGIELRAPEVPQHAACCCARLLVLSSRRRENRTDPLPALSVKSSDLRARALCPPWFDASMRPPLMPATAQVSVPPPRPASDRGYRTQGPDPPTGNVSPKGGRDLPHGVYELNLYFLCLPRSPQKLYTRLSTGHERLFTPFDGDPRTAYRRTWGGCPLPLVRSGPRSYRHTESGRNHPLRFRTKTPEN
jgi:hypothetical protein